MTENQTEGLNFDKLVFDQLIADSTNGDRRSYMNVKEAEEHVGIPGDQILRAINNIRAKGYPVISMTTRRTSENGFRIPATADEYLRWRDKLVDDVKNLVALITLLDNGAKAKFGADLPTQPTLPF